MLNISGPPIISKGIHKDFNLFPKGLGGIPMDFQRIFIGFDGDYIWFPMDLVEILIDFWRNSKEIANTIADTHRHKRLLHKHNNPTQNSKHILSNTMDDATREWNPKENALSMGRNTKHRLQREGVVFIRCLTLFLIKCT